MEYEQKNKLKGVIFAEGLTAESWFLQFKVNNIFLIMGSWRDVKVT